jgi:RimJ/RimL family protein N-acetyltransferase
VPRSDIPTLTTERLVLRPFEGADLAALVVLHADPTFWWYPLRGPMSPDDTEKFLVRVQERYEEDGYGVEAVMLRQTGALIGWAGLAVPHFLPQILPAVEVGWRLAPDQRGLGLASEAGAAAVDFGFSRGGLDRIVSIYEPENEPSGRVMDRLGFTHWQTMFVESHGQVVNVRELSRVTWEARHG